MSLLNKSNVRKLILSFAEQTRHHKFSRVSAQTFEYIESKLKQTCENLVQSHPSKGVTIQPPYDMRGADDSN